MPKKRRPAAKLSGTHVKLRFIKHLLPPVFGITVTVLVFFLLNSQALAVKLNNRFTPPPAAVVTAKDKEVESTAIDPASPPRILINKLNLTAPVNFDLTEVNEGLFQKALQNAVVHYPHTALPGETSNVVVFGHSSGQVWAPGSYKFIFTHLDQLTAGDKIFVEYSGTRYTYEVKKSRVVTPTDLTPLEPSTTPKLTLITCTPVGTSDKRLIVEAEQISPKPKTSPVKEVVSDNHQELDEPNLPSSTPSLWQAIKELFN